MENKQWSWEEPKEPIKKQLPEIPQHLDDDIDEIPIRGIRLSSEIYERSNVAIFEPAEFKEVEKDNKWIDTMKEELRMIEKIET